MPTAAPVTRSEIELVINRMNELHKESEGHLDKIYAQCAATNGRVTSLEKVNATQAGIRQGRKSVFNAVIAVLTASAALTAIIIAVN